MRALGKPLRYRLFHYKLLRVISNSRALYTSARGCWTSVLSAPAGGVETDVSGCKFSKLKKCDSHQQTGDPCNGGRRKGGGGRRDGWWGCAHFVWVGTFCLRLLKPAATRAQTARFLFSFLSSPQPQTITHTTEHLEKPPSRCSKSSPLVACPVQISQNSVFRLTQLSQHPHSLSSS